MHEIDIFSVDWKVPEAISKIERWIVHGYGDIAFYEPFRELKYYEYFFIDQKYRLFGYLFNIAGVFLVCISPVFIIYSLFWRKKGCIVPYILYLICLSGILYWYISAPDYRFSNGFIWGTIFITVIIMLNKKEEINFWNKYGSITFMIATTLIFLLSIKNTFNLYHSTTPDKLNTIYIYPYSSGTLSNVEVYKINDDSAFYLTDEIEGSNNEFPVIVRSGLPDLFYRNKIQNYKTVEMRGTSFKDGFRTKAKYINQLNQKADSIVLTKFE
jgi:hypothetical protein